MPWCDYDLRLKSGEPLQSFVLQDYSPPVALSLGHGVAFPGDDDSISKVGQSGSHQRASKVMDRPLNAIVPL